VELRVALPEREQHSPIRIGRQDKLMIRPKSLVLRELLEAFQVD